MAWSSATPDHTKTYASSADSTSHTVSSWGFTPAKGDMLVLIASCTSASLQPLVPMGWTNTNLSFGAAQQGRSLYRISDGTETSVTITHSASVGMVIHILHFSGQQGVREVNAVGAVDSTGSTMSTGTATGIPANVLVIACFSNKGSANYTSYTNSYTEVAEGATTGGSALDVAVTTFLTTSSGNQETTATASGSATHSTTIFYLSADNTMPTQIASMTNTPSDGINYLGPFISSAGTVYLLSGFATGTAVLRVFKSFDVNAGFSFFDYTLAAPNNAPTSISAQQIGDMLHIFFRLGGATGTSYGYMTLDMSTDTIVTPITFTPVIATSDGAMGVKRSTGGDVIFFYNTTSVTSMSKNYGRIAARRSAGGTGAFGAETQIGLIPSSTNLQSESVDSACLGSSDRVHLFWSQTSTTTAGTSFIFHRTVQSTDNLNGTQPTPAAASINTTGSIANVAPSDAHHCSGQSFMSSGNILIVPYARTNVTAFTAVLTAADADTPTWTDTVVSGATAATAGRGLTTACFKCGGAPYDGTNKTVAWIDNGNSKASYDKDTGSGFGTDVAIDNTNTPGNTGMIYSNVYQRGNNIVLASIYGSSTTHYYNEVVLRTVSVPYQPKVDFYHQLMTQ